MASYVFSGNIPVGTCCTCDLYNETGLIKHVDHYTLYSCTNCDHWSCKEHLMSCDFCYGCCAEEHGLGCKDG